MKGPVTPQPLNDLVARVRAKYPGAYDDMDDATLTKKILAKYPQYSDLAAPKLTVGAPSSLPMKTFTGATAAQNLADVGTGAAEGAANTVGSTTALVSKALNKIPYVGEYLAPSEGITALEQHTKGRSTPQNTAQTVGKLGEQTAEFFLPDAALSDVAKGLEVAKDAPAAAKIFSLAGRGALSGAGTAAVSAAQGQSPKQVAISAGAGAVSPALSDFVASAGPKAAKNIYTRLVRPGTGEFTLDEAREAGTALANEAPVAATRRGLLQKTINAKQKVGQQIGDVVSGATNAGKTVDVSSALKPIEDAMERADQAGNPQLYRQLQDLHDSITHVFENGQMKTSGAAPQLQRVYSLLHDGQEMPKSFVLRDLTSQTPEEANLLKRNVQSDVNFTTPNADALNSTGKSVQGTIGDILRKNIPEVGPLNDQYSGLSNAVKGLTRSTTAEEKRNPVSLYDALTAITSGLGTAGMTHDVGSSIVGGLTGLAAERAVRSDLVQTLAALAAKNAGKAGPAVKAGRNFVLANQ
jgi:hypothetical protein